MTSQEFCPEKKKQGIIQCGDCRYFYPIEGYCPSFKEEKKMKCPKCGHLIGFPEGCVCPESYKKPNPSPRDIFQHIKTECERKAFDEFMGWYSHFVGEPDEWDDKIEDFRMVQIKNMHPDWYSWLVSKSLVKREVVKKSAYGAVYSKEINGQKTIWVKTFYNPPTAKEINEIDDFISVIPLHSWEE